MKRVLLFFSLCLLSAATYAQADSEAAAVNAWPRHELQLGFGDPLFATLLTDAYSIYNPYVNELDAWFAEDIQHQVNLITCTHSLGYKFRALRWLWVGGTFTYTGFASKYDNGLGWKNAHYMTITPELRFSFLNKKYVTLYAGFNAGVAIQCGNIEYYSPAQVHFTGHLNFFGVEVGTRWFGFFELGLGNKGVVCAGLGYHFNCQK